MRGIVISNAGSAADFVSYFSLAVAFLTLFSTVYWSKRSERRSHLDQYWFKQIISPKCVEPVVAFHDLWMERLAEPMEPRRPAWVSEFMSHFHEQRTQLQDGAWVARIFAGDYYEYCCLALDRVEDSIAESMLAMAAGVQQDESIARVRMRAALGDEVVGILAHAARLHGGNYSPIRPAKSKRRIDRFLKRFGLARIESA